MEFFNGLDIYSKFFMAIAVVSTVLFLIKLVLLFGGFDGHDLDLNHADLGMDHADDAFTFLSTQSILAFFMGAGWIGLAANTEWVYGTSKSIMAAAVAGFLAMFIMAFLMKQSKKLNKKIVFKLEECIGKTAKAYTRFLPEAQGQICIEAGGKSRILPAKSSDATEIDAFSAVKVISVENNIINITKNI